MAVSERVAAERGEPLGESVRWSCGYIAVMTLHRFVHGSLWFNSGWLQSQIRGY